MLSLLGKEKLDWTAVHALLVDERWVALDHSNSNDAMLQSTLLKAATGCHYLPLKNEADNAVDGQFILEEQLDELNWPLSIVHLGMGDDWPHRLMVSRCPRVSTAVLSAHPALLCRASWHRALPQNYVISVSGL